MADQFQEECKNCIWNHKCDEGHFLCLFAHCMKSLGQTKREEKHDE